MVTIGVLIVLILILHNIYDNKILTAIVCIDRDSDMCSKLYESLLLNNAKDIIIVTRDSDIRIINFWKKYAIVKTIPHYEIVQRHNMTKIAEKRTIIMDYANKNNYDAIWFVDSDILPTKDVLKEMMKSNKDICIAPYRVKWNNKASVGVESNIAPYFKIHIIDNEKENAACVIGGFGCTLIKKSAFGQKIEYKRINDSSIFVEGEDIGFFLNCYNAGLKCEYIPWEQPHYFDRDTTL